MIQSIDSTISDLNREEKQCFEEIIENGVEFLEDEYCYENRCTSCPVRNLCFMLKNIQQRYF